jgi:hypothetical protein
LCGSPQVRSPHKAHARKPIGPTTPMG